MGSDSSLNLEITSVLLAREGSIRRGNEIRFRCVYPEKHTHGDKKPSAFFNEVNGGWNCKACGAKGCAEDLAKLLGIEVNSKNRNNKQMVICDGLTLEELAAAKGLDIGILRDLGWSTIPKYAGTGKPAVRIPYFNQSGELNTVRFRIDLTKGDRFRYRSGDKAMPYGLNHLVLARTMGRILLVEGETDYAAGFTHEIPVAAIPGATTWKPEWSEYYRNIPEIFVWQEDGMAAENMVKDIGRDIPHIRVVKHPAEGKDICDLSMLLGNNFVPYLEELLSKAVPFAELQAAEDNTQRVQDREKCIHLLTDPALLWKRVQVAQSLGVANEERNLAIIDLAMASRALPNPLNIAIQGPYSSGKSHAVDTMKKLHDSSAIYELTASSELALVYSEEPLQNRIVYFQEAAGMRTEGIGAAVIRSLTWGGQVKYETVEKTSEGLRSRHIEREGPTGLILTTTRIMEPELQSRFFILETCDTPDHLQEAVKVIMKQFGGTANEVPLEDHHALSRYVGKPQNVVLLWAYWLGEAGIESKTTSVLRNITKFLRLAQASALLHQEQRGRDNEGRIIANVVDYAIANRLAAGIFEAHQEGLTQRQREAVEAVTSLYEEENQPVNLATVARKLGIGKESARQRLREPLKQGFVSNEEIARGRPARYRPGEPMPDKALPLPNVEDMAEAFPELCGLFVDPMTGKQQWLGEIPGDVNADNPVQSRRATVLPSTKDMDLTTEEVGETEETGAIPDLVTTLSPTLSAQRQTGNTAADTAPTRPLTRITQTARSIPLMPSPATESTPNHATQDNRHGDTDDFRGAFDICEDWEDDGVVEI